MTNNFHKLAGFGFLFLAIQWGMASTSDLNHKPVTTSG